MLGLKRELAALRAIDRPGFRLYDWSLDGEIAFSVVEHYPGGSLADALAWSGSSKKSRYGDCSPISSPRSPPPTEPRCCTST